MTRLQPHPEGIPRPEPSVISQPFWDGCKRGELLFQRCDQCNRPVFDPAPICRWCTSSNLTWERSRGQGSVYSWSVVWRPQTPAFAIPYSVAIVDVDEGYQLIANVIGCEPDAIFAGMRVAVEFHAIGGGMSLPYFAPTG